MNALGMIMNQRNPLNQKHAHRQSQIAGVWRQNPRIAEPLTHAGQHGEPCSFTLLSSLLHTGVGIGTVTGCLWPKERMMYSEKGILPTPNSGLTLRKCQKYSNIKQERVIEGIPAVTQRVGIPQVCAAPGEHFPWGRPTL